MCKIAYFDLTIKSVTRLYHKLNVKCNCTLIRNCRVKISKSVMKYEIKKKRIYKIKNCIALFICKLFVIMKFMSIIFN